MFFLLLEDWEVTQSYLEYTQNCIVSLVLFVMQEQRYTVLS